MSCLLLPEKLCCPYICACTSTSHPELHFEFRGPKGKQFVSVFQSDLPSLGHHSAKIKKMRTTCDSVWKSEVIGIFLHHSINRFYTVIFHVSTKEIK